MKYLNKYTKFNESSEGSFEEIERDKLLPELLDIVADFIDDGHKVNLSSLHNKISINKYLEGDENLDNFYPVFNAGNKVKSYFKLTISNSNSKESFSKGDDYVNFAKLVNEMSIVVTRINQLGWDLGDFSFNSNTKRFSYLEYTFTKPDVITENDLPSEKQIKDEFERVGLNAEEIEYDDGICYVGAESFSYDGEIPEDIEDKLDRMLKMFGFDYYEKETHQGNTWLSVKFWINPSEEVI